MGKHHCKFQNCTNHVFVPSKQTQSHFLEPILYCSTHICQATFCSQPIIPNFPYCDFHKCKTLSCYAQCTIGKHCAKCYNNLEDKTNFMIIKDKY
ncbi:hypothetical protein QKU48_gp1419 [Fadolivirus algeromassiliense]|jgi:hypothetical protein|uniref:Uncharacterized protein n=1 Tax=Fadolivirus FV1/VV64 TaxID=3070911 RepID=A0A7D3V9C4_9VIRU|nr:hypothetical protein QKU48_gp1419 [Fadolivirus algeromassiliense]QKF94877.1 hypothetical protein Fadolivirus_1_1419 [Fadolivirus FV1/VV64]